MALTLAGAFELLGEVAVDAIGGGAGDELR